MSYGRIRRGPMAADAFTQIRNAVFRDARLSAKAMGIFGNISTHRDGWGITPESLATQMKDGVDAIKSGLRELERYGYLRRTQTKGPNGTFGAAVYFITDQPEAFYGPDELESRSSEPLVENPPTDNPSADEPLAGDHLHKKTNSKKINSKKTLSPLVVAEAPATDEREIIASLPKTKANDDPAKVADAWQVARGRGRNPAAEGKVADSAALLLSSGWSIPDLVALAEDMARRQPAYTDLAKHEPHWVRPKTVAALPPWCGQCDGEPLAERWKNNESGAYRCPDCNPYVGR